MDGKFYPSGSDGDMFHCGTGAGLGLYRNPPNTSGLFLTLVQQCQHSMANKGYGRWRLYVRISTSRHAHSLRVRPRFRDRYVYFCEDWVKLIKRTVAAGFDAAAGDELGGCFVTPACYAHMTSMLSHLAHGKIAICLEVRLYMA